MTEIHELTWYISPECQAPHSGIYTSRSEAAARAYLAGLLAGAGLNADSVSGRVVVAVSITAGTIAPVLLERWDGTLPDVRDAVNGR